MKTTVSAQAKLNRLIDVFDAEQLWYLLDSFEAKQIDGSLTEGERALVKTLRRAYRNRVRKELKERAHGN